MGRDNYDNEDKFLLSAVCEGDRRAFDCIFRRYYVDIVMFCGRFLGRREDCEDIAQTVFLTLWEKREPLRVLIIMGETRDNAGSLEPQILVT